MKRRKNAICPKLFYPIAYISDAIFEVESIIHYLHSPDTDDESRDIYDRRFPYNAFYKWLCSIYDGGPVPSEFLQLTRNPMPSDCDDVFLGIYKEIYHLYHADAIGPGSVDKRIHGIEEARAEFRIHAQRDLDQQDDMIEYCCEAVVDFNNPIEYCSETESIRFLSICTEMGMLTGRKLSYDDRFAYARGTFGGYRLYDDSGFYG